MVDEGVGVMCSIYSNVYIQALFVYVSSKVLLCLYSLLVLWLLLTTSSRSSYFSDSLVRVPSDSSPSLSLTKALVTDLVVVTLLLKPPGGIIALRGQMSLRQ